MSFSVTTYNVLADAYANRAWYRRTPALVLDPIWRVPALVQYIAAFDAHIICLQEVEPHVLAALRLRLSLAGYGLQYGRKNACRPDGCAIFYQQANFDLVDARVMAYADADGASADSGYVALIARFRGVDGVIGVVNTHLTWDPPGTTSDVAPRLPAGTSITARMGKNLRFGRRLDSRRGFQRNA